MHQIEPIADVLEQQINQHMAELLDTYYRLEIQQRNSLNATNGSSILANAQVSFRQAQDPLNLPCLLPP